MASMLFTESSEGLTLGKMRQSVAAAAEKLNDERAKIHTVLFANVYVGPVLKTPRTKALSFLVSYSDKDLEAPELVVEALKRLADSERRNLWWYVRRDPYCA